MENSRVNVNHASTNVRARSMRIKSTLLAMTDISDKSIKKLFSFISLMPYFNHRLQIAQIYV